MTGLSSWALRWPGGIRGVKAERRRASVPRGQPCLQAGIGREESDQGIRTGAAHGAVEAAGKSGNWTRTLSVWSPTTQFATASGRTPRKELGRWAGIDLTISCAQAQNSPIGAQPRPSGPFFFPWVPELPASVAMVLWADSGKVFVLETLRQRHSAGSLSLSGLHSYPPWPL